MEEKYCKCACCGRYSHEIADFYLMSDYETTEEEADKRARKTLHYSEVLNQFICSSCLMDINIYPSYRDGLKKHIDGELLTEVLILKYKKAMKHDNDKWDAETVVEFTLEKLQKLVGQAREEGNENLARKLETRIAIFSEEHDWVKDYYDLDFVLKDCIKRTEGEITPLREAMNYVYQEDMRKYRKQGRMKCACCGKRSGEIEYFIKGAMKYNMPVDRYFIEECKTRSSILNYFICDDCLEEAEHPTASKFTINNDTDEQIYRNIIIAKCKKKLQHPDTLMDVKTIFIELRKRLCMEMFELSKSDNTDMHAIIDDVKEVYYNLEDSLYWIEDGYDVEYLYKDCIERSRGRTSYIRQLLEYVNKIDRL